MPDVNTKRKLTNNKVFLKKRKIIQSKSSIEPSIDELLQNLIIENDNISFNEFYKNRINKYNIITSNNIELKNQCLITQNHTIRLNIEQKKIILKNIIGYGATSHIFNAEAFYDNDNKKIDIIFKILSLGENEINFMNKISEFVINQTTPHFIINYISKNNCNKIDEIIDDYQINDFIKIINNYAKEYTNNTYSLIAMEKLDGDVANLLFFNKNIDDTIKNIIKAQMYIALLTFHLYLKSIHNDVQYKNFFYKKINNSDNGYFYYNFIFNNGEIKDVYIKNIGYLIVLADYGFSKKIYFSEDTEHIEKQILTRQKKSKTYLEDYSMIFDDYNLLKDNIKRNITEENFFKELISKNNSFIKELPQKSFLLNAKPYILDFTKEKIHSI